MASVEGEVPVIPIERETGVTYEGVDYKEKQKTWLFGYPVSHSLSPLLHNSIYKNLGLEGWTYTLFESTSIPDFLQLLSEPLFLGASVTMPHKITIIPHLDGLSKACKAIGACNTIVARPGKGKYSSSRVFIGVNTDCAGIREAIKRGLASRGVDVPAEKRDALIIGGGGTTRSSVYALNTWLNSGRIYLLNRDPEETRAVMEQFAPYGVDLVAVDPETDVSTLPEFFYIVGCIPDIPPVTPAEHAVKALTQKILSRRTGTGVLLDMCYKPRWTTLLGTAEKAGWITVEGIECMIDQGIEQEIFWTGFDPKDMNDVALAELIRKADEIQQKK
ncbi:hypothetical protein RUND412_011263 [Rhizina undulata]